MYQSVASKHKADFLVCFAVDTKHDQKRSTFVVRFCIVRFVVLHLC